MILLWPNLMGQMITGSLSDEYCHLQLKQQKPHLNACHWYFLKTIWTLCKSYCSEPLETKGTRLPRMTAKQPSPESRSSALNMCLNIMFHAFGWFALLLLWLGADKDSPGVHLKEAFMLALEWEILAPRCNKALYSTKHLSGDWKCKAWCGLMSLGLR